jgi:hypothetical protein
MGIDEPLVGLLNSKPFAQGTMKVAFDVSQQLIPCQLIPFLNLLFTSFTSLMGSIWSRSASSV